MSLLDVPPGASSYTVLETAASAAALLAGVEDAWATAYAIRWGPAPYETRFRALWNESGLSLRFDVSDRQPWHTMARRDDRIWEEEVVEVFLDPDCTGRNYAELEISPANVVCDLAVATPWPDLRADPAWHIAGLETQVTPFAGPPAAPDGWTAIARLPWKPFSTLPASVRLPPAAGDRWRFNVFRIKRPGGPSRPEEDVLYAAWSPTGGPSFHVPSAFRDFVFASAAGNR